MSFEYRLHNRLTYPHKHVLICEDNLTQQKRILEHFHDVFPPEGHVQFSVVGGTMMAEAIIDKYPINLIILDHDLPYGNGSDLLTWMKEKDIKIPVITFSGIPYNNAHMMNLGADHHFQKEEVISGKADNIIKQILTLHSGVAEDYVNTICINQPTSKRYWVTPELMVGGSIIDANDFKHLQDKYYIGGVLNMESEHSDIDKGIENLCEIQVPDNGTPFPEKFIREAALFTDKFLTENKGKANLYVHCQMGGSRSPAFAYMVLRHHYKMTPEQAFGQIKGVVPGNNYGHHHYHQSYIDAIEKGLASLNKPPINTQGVAEYYVNTLSPNKPTIARYWITPTLLVGGNICNKEELDRLVNDFGVRSIINVDAMQDHTGLIDNLLQVHVNDDGDGFPEGVVHQVVRFAKAHYHEPIYIHCHIGFSRSPHFAYAILRLHGFEKEDAYRTVKDALPTLEHKAGFNRFTTSYIESIERALTTYVD